MAVVELLAALSESEAEGWAESVLREASARRGVLVGGMIYMKLCHKWTATLQSLRIAPEVRRRVLAGEASMTGGLRELVIDGRSAFEALAGKPADRCLLSLLDAAIFAGDLSLVKALRRLQVPQVFPLELSDFLDPRSDLLLDKHVRILEAAVLAGVDLGSLSDGCWRFRGRELTLDLLQEIAIACKQRKAAMILRRSGAAASFRGTRRAALLFSVAGNRRQDGGFLLDPGCVELASDLGVDLRAARVDPDWAVRMAVWKEYAGWCCDQSIRVERGAPKSLLEMAILCGQREVGEQLARLGCDASGLAAESLQPSAAVSCKVHQRHGPRDCAFSRAAEPVRVARRVHRVLRAEYWVQILQLAGWWRRAPDGSGGSCIAAGHAHLVELIADFASALPLLPELPVPRARPSCPTAQPLRAAAGAEPPQEAEEEVEEVAPAAALADLEDVAGLGLAKVIDLLETPDPAGEIDQAEAAAVSQDGQASGVKGAREPRREEIVVFRAQEAETSTEAPRVSVPS